jgi:hypothetical protein
MTDWIYEKQKEAAGRVEAMLALPMPAEDFEFDDEHFMPWDLFPAIYGTYSGDYDKMAVEVLTDLRDGSHIRDDLAAYMFKEMLCVMSLCDYGTSPRVCFPTSPFDQLLPSLIERWKEWYGVNWKQPYEQSE